MKIGPPTLAEVREAEVREGEVLAEVQAGFEQMNEAEVAGLGPKVITWLHEETKTSLKGLVDVIQGDVEEWPGINEDIKVVRSGCRTCDVNTPSQPKEPQLLFQTSSTPSSRSVQTTSPSRPGSTW